jgi:DUF1009 family protein
MSKIALIIGGGMLPFEILKNFKKEDVFIVAIKEAEVDCSKLEGYDFTEISFAKVGKIMKLVKQRGITNICFAGNVKKPSFSSLKPDLKGFFLLFKILQLKLRGDDALFKTIILFLERNGIKIKGVNEVCKNLVMKTGVLTDIKPSSFAIKEGEAGLKILKEISLLDIGQALAIQEGVILGIEAIEGTDALIERCGKLKNKSKNSPILVKCAKKQQTLKIDMPVIGFNTIKILAEWGFLGVFIEANSSLFVEQEKSIEFANQNGIFIVGI